MEAAAQIECPYCGQSMELLIDTTQARQQFAVDCEVCCRPMEISAECEPGEVISVTANS